MDLGPAFLKSVTTAGHAPQAVVCANVFHLVKLVSDALDEVRRDLWQTLRRLPDDRWAKDFKGSRWSLLKNPEDLTDNQAAQLARIRRTRGGIWRAYEMKEQFRTIFAGDLTRKQAAVLLDRWCGRAQRSRLAPFIKTAKTMRQRRDMILNALEHGISNGHVEGLNTKARRIIRSAYGFHTADAALALARHRTHRPQTPTRTVGRSDRSLIHTIVRRAEKLLGESRHSVEPLLGWGIEQPERVQFGDPGPLIGRC